MVTVLTLPEWVAVQEDLAAAAIKADPQRCVCQGKLCPKAGHLPVLQPVCPFLDRSVLC